MANEQIKNDDLHNEQVYKAYNMKYFNAQKQQEERKMQEARDQRHAERVARKKARAKKEAALVVAGVMAVSAVVGTQADNIKEGFSNIKEKFTTLQTYEDPIREIEERTGKSGEEIYSEYIDQVQEERAQGLDVTQSEEGYKDFVKNYDRYMNDELENNQSKGAR